MTPIRSAIFHTLDVIGQDDLILSFLLMMRDRGMMRVMTNFANTHPSLQQMISACRVSEGYFILQAANENGSEREGS